MRNIHIAFLLFLLLLSTSSDVIASDAGYYSSCYNQISEYISPRKSIVRQLRIKRGGYSPTTITLEMADPAFVNSKALNGWSFSFPVASPDQAEKLVASVENGSWIAFQRGLDESLAYRLFFGQRTHCDTASWMGDLESSAGFPPSISETLVHSKNRFFAFPPRRVKTTVVSTSPTPKSKIGSDTPSSLCREKISPNSRTVSLSFKNGEFSVGEIDGNQPALRKIPASQSEAWARIAETGNAWAAYEWTQVDGVHEMHVQYAFDENGQCSVYPEKPERISTIYLPEAVTSFYLKQQGEQVSGDIFAQRSRLQHLLTKATEETSTEGDPYHDEVPDAEMLSDFILRRLPKAALRVIDSYQGDCQDTSSTLRIDKETIARIDIDGDSDEDIVINGDHIYCVGKDGHTVVIGAGNAVARLAICIATKNQYKIGFDGYASWASIKRHRGFATVDLTAALGESVRVLIRSNKTTRISSIPKGGTEVYALTR